MFLNSSTTSANMGIDCLSKKKTQENPVNGKKNPVLEVS